MQVLKLKQGNVRIHPRKDDFRRELCFCHHAPQNVQQLLLLSSPCVVTWWVVILDQNGLVLAKNLVEVQPREFDLRKENERGAISWHSCWWSPSCQRHVFEASKSNEWGGEPRKLRITVEWQLGSFNSKFGENRLKTYLSLNEKLLVKEKRQTGS